MHFSVAVTVVWVVAIMNLINLIDGLDGLAGGVSLMLMSLLAYLAYSEGFVFFGTVLGMVGAILDFLFIITTGESLYGGLGSVCNWLCYCNGLLLNTQKGTVIAAMIAPVLALPSYCDVAFAIIRRV